jgi:hypothetical protein
MLSKGSRVIEREEVLDIVGNGANFGVIQSIPINPGQAASFPTLSKQALIWQRYKFRKLRYEYEPTVNEFATAGTTGKVIFQVNIDAADGAPTTKAAAYATDKQLINSDLPSRKFSLNLPPRYLMPVGKDWRYVRQAGLPGAADIHEYDVGNLFISTTGTVDNTTKLGELHVYYTIEFENLLNSALEAAPINNQVSLFQSTSAQTFTTTVNTTSLGATASANGLAIVNTAGSMVPQVGNYNVDFGISAQDSANEAFHVILDFQKNGTSVFTVSPPGQEVGATNTGNVSVAGSSFVTANGTDAFTLKVQMYGVTGVLTGNTWVRWVAV